MLVEFEQQRAEDPKAEASGMDDGDSDKADYGDERSPSATSDVEMVTPQDKMPDEVDGIKMERDTL
eukprot:9153611-Karenia_brevis.AAC.1